MDFIELLPNHWWLPVILAAALLADVAVSIRPLSFVRDCLNGVNFPEDWWWTLIVIKSLAAAGLIVGAWADGIAVAANVGVIAYFLAAAAAHVRARFLGRAFWLNCLGMLTLSVGVFVLSFVV